MSEPVLVAIAVAAIGSLAGVAALIRAIRSSGPEADNQVGLAASAIVGSAGDVVTMLREQMADLHVRLDQAEARILLLEAEVGTWEAWAERVLDLLDRALSMMATKDRVALRDDVDDVKATRPLRRRRGEPDAPRP